MCKLQTHIINLSYCPCKTICRTINIQSSCARYCTHSVGTIPGTVLSKSWWDASQSPVSLAIMCAIISCIRHIQLDQPGIIDVIRSINGRYIISHTPIWSLVCYCWQLYIYHGAIFLLIKLWSVCYRYQRSIGCRIRASKPVCISNLLDVYLWCCRISKIWPIQIDCNTILVVNHLCQLILYIICRGYIPTIQSFKQLIKIIIHFLQFCSSDILPNRSVGCLPFICKYHDGCY